MGEHTAMLISEQRRNPQLSYKSDIIFISGLDEGDRRAVEKHFRGNDPPCQLDPEDGRFVLKGPKYNPMVIVNILAEERGYKILYNPQQRSIPLKQGSTDDKFALVFFLSKPIASKSHPSMTAASSSSVASQPADNPPDVITSEQ